MEEFKIIKGIKSIIFITVITCLFNIPVYAASPTISQCDINGDGIVSTSDIVAVANDMGKTGTSGWIKEDVDQNGIVQVCDLMFVANYYGQSVNQNNGGRIQKLSIAYSDVMGDTENQKFIANHFDMVDCSSTATTGAANVKALNPNIKILGYYDSIMQSKTYSDWNTVNSHEDWFAHSLGGSRIERIVYPGQYLMNPNSGWSNYFAQRCKTFLTTYPQFDGIFADDASYNLNDDGYTFRIPFTQFQMGLVSNWGTYMINYLRNVKTTIGNHLLMPNAYKNTYFCQDSTHIHFWENFIHGRSSAYNENGYGTNGWNYGLGAVDSLHAQAELGNIIAVNCGCENADAHPTQAKQWMLFTYACFSFAVVDVNKAYYSWQFYNSDSSHGYYPEMDITLGQPVGDYYQVSGTAHVYARQFTNYYVAANLNLLGTGSVTFTINGASRTLAPRTAVFIPK